MPVLRVARGRSSAEEFAFRDEIIIGRAEECGVRVFDEAASRRHARIVRHGADFVAEDLESVNGLFVNGRRVPRHVLRTGDELSVRGLTLVFLADGSAERPTVLRESALQVEARRDPAAARLQESDDDLPRRLAALYRVAGVLGGAPARLRADLLRALEEAFAPCRAALVLPDGEWGRFSRAVVDRACRAREALLVRDPGGEHPGSSSIVAEKITSAMAAPLGAFGALAVDRSGGAPFREGDLELLAAMALSAAPVLRPDSVPPPPSPGGAELLGASPAMDTLRKEIARVAPTDATVLITGETGTGKELVARALHAGGRRARGPFVAVNCAAFVETLLEAEIFGHEKGAFTGADRMRAGRFEQAHGGTLFLDEVGELTPGTQAKLLRVLETREFHRVGAARPTRVDVRILAATNRDLRGGGFRADLYFRLAVVTLPCPPLRERGEDVALLARRFLGEGLTFDEQALGLLRAYSWPGNVRELRNVCERCAVLARGTRIPPEELPLEVRIGREGGGEGEVRTLREMERAMVVRALAKTGGNRTQAAKLLGITYPTLKKRIDEFGL
ncbi:MAG: sigma 54-interacting transcriptional regulator [Planctomycetaceae bacterium]